MSDTTPEPTGVGPMAGGHLRASDADREKVAAVLSTAFAEGRLTREEHDERLDRLLRARTFDELVPLTHDLVLLPTTQPPLTNPPQRGYAVDTPSTEDAETLVAVFSGVSRNGTWRLRRRTRAFAVFGGIDLDLRNAVFDGSTVEISGFWVFGGLDLKVPEGIEVQDRTVGIFGGTDIRDLGAHQPGAPVLVVKGFTLFGGVAVRGPKRRHLR